MKYTEKELLNHLQEVSEELGQTPTMEDITGAGDRPSTGTYQRRFGTRTNALEEAGLTPRNVHRTDEALLDDLRALADELGRTPVSKDTDDVEYVASYVTYASRFGKWNNALREAGLEPAKKQPTGKFSEEELLTHIKELGDELGRAPTGDEMDEADGRPTTGTYRRAFESWTSAVREAGFKPVRKRASQGEKSFGGIKYSRDELVNHLQELADELGRTPIGADMQEADDRPSIKPFRRAFGSWTNAVEEAGLEPNRPVA